MTREEARKAAEVMLAYANGEEIETLCFDNYIPCENPSFNWINGKGIKNYRIKPKPNPEPKYRPFKSQEECWNEMLKHKPLGWLRSKRIKDIYLLITIRNHEIRIFDDLPLHFSKAYRKYEFQDGSPFGIKEE